MDREAVKLGQDLAPMDRRNGEEQVRSRSMDQRGHVMIWSDLISFLIVSVHWLHLHMEMMERNGNAQGKGIT